MPCQTTYEIKEKTQIGLHIHHKMHNCQYTSFLGFAKLEKKKDGPCYHDNHQDQQHENKELECYIDAKW